MYIVKLVTHFTVIHQLSHHMEKTNNYLEPACEVIILHAATAMLQTSVPDMQGGNTFSWNDEDLWQ